MGMATTRGKGPLSVHSRGRIWVASVLALAGLLLAQGSAVHASSNGTIQFTPATGQAGTVVDVNINLSVSPAEQYALVVTNADPAQGGCGNTISIPGVAPVTVNEQGGHTQFSWPASFDASRYWFCAIRQSGSGPRPASTSYFTVLTTGGAVSTAPPPPQVALVPRKAAIHPGDVVQVSVANWLTANSQPPTGTTLVSVNSGQQMKVPFTVATGLDAMPGTYVLDVQIPVQTPPDSYYFLVTGAYSLQTEFFTVTSAATPTAATRISDTHPQTRSTDPSPVAILGAVVVLLLLATALMAAAVIRQRRGMQSS